MQQQQGNEQIWEEKMKKANQTVRTALTKRNVYQWELAERLGISEYTLTRKLRKELPEDQQEEMVRIIESIGGVLNDDYNKTSM